MHFHILRLRLRQRGRPIGKRPEMIPTIPGDVLIEMLKSSPMGRPSLCARINNPDPNAPELPPLYDAEVNTMIGNSLVITGVEFVNGVAYAQSWHCRVAE